MNQNMDQYEFKNMDQNMKMNESAPDPGICGGPGACEGREYDKENKECLDCVADAYEAMEDFSTMGTSMSEAEIQGKLFEMYKMSNEVFHGVSKERRPLALAIGQAIVKLGESLDSSKNSISAEEPK
jgi:hypothetical protein